jgi:hypothetical protein
MERYEIRAQKVITGAAECATALRQWHGVRARVWRYHASLSRLAICIFRTDEPKLAFLIASTCRFIRGPFSWENNAIEILTDSASSIRVIDESSGFELDCASVSIIDEPVEDFEFE